jgi:hypothetical protein
MALNALKTASLMRFIASLVDDAACGLSTVVTIPPFVDAASLLDQVIAEGSRRDMVVRDVPALVPDDDPLDVIVEGLGHEWSSPEAPRTVGAMLRSDLIPDATVVDCTGLPASALSAWEGLARRWADATKALADAGGRTPAIAVFCRDVGPGTHSLPEEIHLRWRCSWGMPSALEMQLLCREAGMPGDALEGRWREFVLPALACGDTDLAQDLWQACTVSLDQLLTVLTDYGRRRGWTAVGLAALTEAGALCGMRRGGDRERPPAKPAVRLWAQGVLVCTLEYGVEIHTAAAAVLGGNDVIRHRLWRGQAALLLPVLDRVRLALCEALAGDLGPDWACHWEKPDSEAEARAVAEDPLACGWGHLAHLARNCPPVARSCRSPEVVAVGRRLRNEIAHHRPVPFREYRRLVALVEEVGLDHG